MKGITQLAWIRWKGAMSNKTFLYEFIVSVIVAFIVLTAYQNFLTWLESRPGVILNDPVLALLSPTDLSGVIFIVLSIGIIAGFIELFFHPKELLLAVQSYIFLISIRIVFLYVTPFAPPADTVLLRDPLVEMFNNHGIIFTKDLFFSGHTATAFMLFFVAKKLWIKTFFASVAILIGYLVLKQHVHYTIDVLVAPFMAYSSCRIAFNIEKMIERWGIRHRLLP